jgi:ABC-type Fe3+ transport system substrate-binding protein
MLRNVLIAAAAALALLPVPAGAQNADAEWNATLAKARTQTLVMVNQGSPSYDNMIAAFTKKFGIEVEATVARPTVILPRVKTEQANGQYLWDVWWATTSNMVSVAAPAGMLQPFEPFLILPEVKDINQWRHPDYIYGDAGRMVFTHSHEVSFSAYRNTDAIPGFKVDNVDALLDPRLKGKVIMRDASQPNAGSWAIAPIYKAKGGEFLRRVLKEQQPKVVENPQQLDTAIMRGTAAVAFGMQGSSYSKCVKDSGCKNVQPLGQLAAASSRGLSVFKNAPHPEAAKIFINWVLSKEGQELFVKEWGAHNETGGVSMRKDVEPYPDHKTDLPDFSKADQYVWVATDDGAKDVAAVVKIFKEVMGK